MRWKKKGTIDKKVPYYYVSVYEDLELSLYPPSDERSPWITKLAIGGETVFSTNISMGDRNNLEEAKEMAFNVMGAYTRNWTNGVQNKLAAMKMLPAVL